MTERPTHTRRYKANDLGRAVRATRVVLRESDDEDSPRKWVANLRWRKWTEALPSSGLDEVVHRVEMGVTTVTFFDGTLRVLNLTDEVEIGWVEPDQR